MIEYLKPTQFDINHLADNMCAADTAEVWASHRHTPRQAIEAGVNSSDYMTAVRMDGVPIGIYGLGVRDILIGEGTLWMLTTDGMRKAWRDLVTVTPLVIEGMFSVCTRLSNHVHADNKMSIRWLRSLGFIIEPPEPIGVGGEMFHEFYMTKASRDV